MRKSTFFILQLGIICLWLISCQPATASPKPPVTFTPTMQPSVSPSATPTLKLAPTLTATATLKGPGRFVGTFGVGYFTDVYRSPNGKLVFTIINNKEIRWYDAKTLQQKGSIVLDGTSYRIIFGPAENLVAIGGLNKVWLLDITQQKIFRVIDIGGDYFRQIEFFQNSKSLIYEQYHPTSGGCYSDLNAWDGENFENFTILTLNCKGSQFAVSPDGILLALGYEHEIKIWDNWKAGPSKVLNEHNANITTVAFSADSKLLASADEKGNIYVWDCKTWKHISSFSVAGSIEQVSFINNDQQIQVAIKNQLPQIIDLKTQQIKEAPLKEKETDPLQQVLYNQGYSKLFFDSPNIAVSPNQKLLAVAGQSILLWDIESKKLVGVLENKTGRSIGEIRFDPSNRFVAGAIPNKEVLLWDITQKADPKIPQILLENDVVKNCTLYECGFIDNDNITCTLHNCSKIAFSSDGKFLALSREKNVELWDTQTATKLAVFAILNDPAFQIVAIQFSTDGRFVYVSSIKQADLRTLQVWDVSTKKMVYQLHLPIKGEYQYYDLISWPWLTFLNFAGSNHGIGIWNLETNHLRKFNLGEQMSPEGFDQNGELLVIGGGACIMTPYILKVATGDFIYQFSKAPFNEFSLLANSHFVASRSESRPIDLWDISDILDSLKKPNITPFPSPTYVPCSPG